MTTAARAIPTLKPTVISFRKVSAGMAVALGTEVLVPEMEVLVPGLEMLVPEMDVLLPGMEVLVPGMEVLIFQTSGYGNNRSMILEKQTFPYIISYPLAHLHITTWLLI